MVQDLFSGTGNAPLDSAAWARMLTSATFNACGQTSGFLWNVAATSQYYRRIGESWNPAQTSLITINGSADTLNSNDNYYAVGVLASGTDSSFHAYGLVGGAQLTDTILYRWDSDVSTTILRAGYGVVPRGQTLELRTDGAGNFEIYINGSKIGTTYVEGTQAYTTGVPFIGVLIGTGGTALADWNGTGEVTASSGSLPPTRKNNSAQMARRTQGFIKRNHIYVPDWLANG